MTFRASVGRFPNTPIGQESELAKGARFARDKQPHDKEDGCLIYT